MPISQVIFRLFLLSLCLAQPLGAWATNGMNMEGYGPIASAMGGAGIAYDNGTAAVMINPATLGLMNDESRLDVALGKLGPDVSARHEASGSKATSSADAFYMPALGYVRRQQRFVYGLGVFAQGGMGTEYGADSFLSNPGQITPSPQLVNRSEVSVGRAIVPLVWQPSERWQLGLTVDFVWAGIDLQMAMNEAQFQDLANPAAQQMGNAGGSLVNAFGAMYEPFGGTGIKTLHHAYFDFSNDNDYSGAAKGYGGAGKIGVIYQANPAFTVGASYHSKTRLGDLKTSNADLSMAVNIDTGVAAGGAPSGTYADATIPLSGQVSIPNFEWPAMLALGVAYQAGPRWLIAADVKRIQWSDVMEDFKVIFTADNSPSNGGFANAELNTTLYQNWDDQTVLNLGLAYQATSKLAVRAGVNVSKNPIPTTRLNALFPAIVEDHVSAGFGYKVTSNNEVNFSLTRASDVSSTSANGITSTHAQTNWQIMYSRHW